MGEIIGWETVFFNQNNIVLDFRAGMEVAHYFVVPLTRLWVGFKADWEAWLPFWGRLGAVITVEIRDFFRVIFVSIGFDCFGIGRIGVGATGGN